MPPKQLQFHACVARLHLRQLGGHFLSDYESLSRTDLVWHRYQKAVRYFLSQIFFVTCQANASLIALMRAFGKNALAANCQPSSVSIKKSCSRLHSAVNVHQHVSKTGRYGNVLSVKGLQPDQRHRETTTNQMQQIGP